MEWLRKSSTTYENVTLSARMIKLAVECGIGSYIEVQSVRTKYAALLQEYTAEEKLAAISQFFTIPRSLPLALHIASPTVSSYGHRSSFNPPLSMLEHKNHVSSF